MPPRERKSSGMKAMTPSEEKELEEVLGMAARQATKNARDLMIPNSPGVASDGKGSDDDRSPRSPRFHGVFNFANKFRRQSSKDKSSTDDVQLSSTSSVIDEPSVEAQEAYNVLVGRGMTHSATTPESLNSGTRKENGVVRVRRTLHHQNAVTSDAPARPAPRTTTSNSHIRHPQGIPGREAAVNSTVATATEDNGGNPLRMLRASRSFPPIIPVRKAASEPQSCNDSDDGTPVWSPQVPGVASDTMDDAPLPLPPRKPATFMTNLNQKPRERKYPLVMDGGSALPSSVKEMQQAGAQNSSSGVSHQLSFASEPADSTSALSNGRSNGRPISIAGARTNGRDSAVKSIGRTEPMRAYPLIAGSSALDNGSKQTANEVNYYDNTVNGTNGYSDISVLSPRYSVDTSVSCEADISYEEMLECVLENPDLNFAR